MQSLNEKIQKYKYNMERKAFINRWITNIGTIMEEEDKIICYVNQKLLEKYKRRKGYTIFCNGIPIYEKMKQKIKYYQLDKPVYYIFDGIQVDFMSFSSIFNSTLVFKNCTFNHKLSFISTDKVILQNNTYNSWTKNSIRQGDFLSGEIKELIVQNDYLANQFKGVDNSQDFGVDITTDRLTMMNSTIVAENEGQIYIKAKEAYFMDSTIEAPEMYLDLDNIAYINSLLKSSKGIMIENENCNCDLDMGFYKVDSPYVVYNGMEIINKEKEEQKQNEENLTEVKIPLVQLFTNLQNKCNQEIVTQYLRKEAEQPISRVLKKEE